MKKLLLLPLLFIFILPAQATASVSFTTEEYVAFREMVFDLEDSNEEPATAEEKETLLAELRASAETAKDSLLTVLAGQTASLDASYAKAKARVDKQATNRQTRALKAIDKSCARQKAGKTPRRQAAIEKNCQKRREAAKQRIAKWQAKEMLPIERRYGKDSRAREILEERYTGFEERRIQYLARGEVAIAERPEPAE